MGGGFCRSGLFCCDPIEKCEKIRSAEFVLGLFRQKLLTFDRCLYIRGIEGNYCFICVGFLYVKTESAFRKGKTKEYQRRCVDDGR